MGFPKYYEDIVETRRENGAAIVNEYQYPQENRRRVAHVETHRTAPDGLKLFDKIRLRRFVLQLESDPEHVSPDLLKQTLDWTRAHYEELARMSPGASAHLAMAYRDRLMKFRTPEPELEPEPSYRVVGPRKPFIFEVRKRELGAQYADCY